MKLSHLDLHVPDVAATAAFFQRYFAFTLVDTRANGGLAILSDGGDLELVLSHAIAAFGSVDQSERRAVSYHIGFIVAARDEVERVFKAMSEDGLDVQAPREMRGDTCSTAMRLGTSSSKSEREPCSLSYSAALGSSSRNCSRASSA